jgi:hypothetical protein
MPVTLALRGLLHRGRLELDGDLGAVGGFLGAEGSGTSMPRTGSRFEVGIAAAIAARVWLLRERLAPFAALSVDVYPRPYHLDLSPPGVSVGTTPIVWLNASLGLTYRIR